MGAAEGRRRRGGGDDAGGLSRSVERPEGETAVRRARRVGVWAGVREVRRGEDVGEVVVGVAVPEDVPEARERRRAFAFSDSSRSMLETPGKDGDQAIDSDEAVMSGKRKRVW